MCLPSPVDNRRIYLFHFICINYVVQGIVLNETHSNDHRHFLLFSSSVVFAHNARVYCWPHCMYVYKFRCCTQSTNRVCWIGGDNNTHNKPHLHSITHRQDNYINIILIHNGLPVIQVFLRAIKAHCCECVCR